MNFHLVEYPDGSIYPCICPDFLEDHRGVAPTPEETAILMHGTQEEKDQVRDELNRRATINREY